MWEERPQEMQAALEVHDEVVRGLIESGGGYVFSTAGDSFAAAFGRAADAVTAAERIQDGLENARWGAGVVLRVRVGLHTGEAQERGGDYFGSVLNRAARVMSAGHGGQSVMTAATAGLIERDDLVDLGEHRLSDVSTPMRLYQLRGRVDSFPALRSLDGVESTLPEQRTPLIGRHVEVEAVRRMLAESRLVTLTGVGGTGKTRLGIEVAIRELPHAAGGGFFVDLARVSDPGAVTAAFVEGLGLMSAAETSDLDILVQFLGARHVVVVVDNCEHVLDEAAALVDVLLDRCSGLRILATSREALELDGERTFRVPSLAMTDKSLVGPAVRLFVERAVAADDRLVVDDELLEAAHEVCERLDGIPLAIELAAARVRSMDMSELVSRLEDRFSLLTGGRRGAQQRQRTLQAALDWSHDLLSSTERMVFRRLAVFVGDFGLDAVAPVADVESATGADVVDSLVAKSLVVMNRQTSGGARYRLLETVRYYSEDRLTEADETEVCRARHRRHYVGLVRRAPVLMGDWLGINSHLIEPDSDNINAAAQRARDQGDHTATVLLLALGTQANARSPRTRMQPALEAIQENIELASLTDADRGPVMLATAAMSLALGRFRESRDALDAAVACIGDPPPQWAITARYLHLLPRLMTDPESAIDELDWLSDKVVPLLPSPAFGSLILAEGRSMALTRLRRYTDVAERDAAALATGQVADLPLVGHTPLALASSGLIASHLAGRPDMGEPFIAVVSGRTDVTWWYPYFARIGESLHLADTVDIDTARAALVSAATSDERTRIAIGDSGYLTAFARLAHLEGDNDRAVHYLTYTAVFFPSTAALAAETLGAIEGWTNEEFFDRSTADMLTRMSRRRRVGAQAIVPQLLRAELDRWSK